MSLARCAIVFACVALASATAHADETAQKQAAESEPNEALRAKEGATTALPSVAGRPVRRYAESQVLELGGAVSFTSSPSLTQIAVLPSFGWFFVDYVQLSVLPGVQYAKTHDTGWHGRFSLLAEPSFHIPVVGPLFVFFGAGMGGVYDQETGGGLAVAPRAGINLLIGGSGVLTGAYSYVYTANERPAAGETDPHTRAHTLQFGFSVAW